MALPIIWGIILIAMCLACLPIAQKYYLQHIKKIGYWSILINILFYILIDIWIFSMASRVSMTKIEVLTFILINLSGLISTIRIYKELKKYM